MSFIEVRNLKYRYPRTEKLALDGLGFNVEKGEFIGILGKNKAGKSTLCQAFMGLVPGMFGGAYGGQVMIDGMEASRTPVSVLCRKVGLVFQNPFNQLSGARDTVFGEVAFGLQNLGVPREEILKRVERSLELLEISPYRERNPFDLSGGQIQRVAIAGILAMEPEVLVLDEPTSQLDPQGSEEVFRVVDRLAGSGITIIMAEHKMEKLASYCSRLLLHEGKQIAYDSPEHIFAREDLKALGIEPPVYTQAARVFFVKYGDCYPVTLDQTRAVRERFPGKLCRTVKRNDGEGSNIKGIPSPAPLFSIQDLGFSYAKDRPVIKALDLELDQRPTAVIGQNGAGKTTLVKLLKGLLKPDSGRILLQGEDMGGKTVAGLAGRVGYVFQNPDDQIFKNRVLDEVMVGPLNLGMEKAESRKRAIQALETVGLWAVQGENPYDLDLADRKMVAIASVLAMEPQVLILDEPTIAQDAGGRRRLGSIVRKLAREGKMVLAILHDMDFAAMYFERIIVMAHGRVLADGPKDQVYYEMDALREARLEQPHVARLCGCLGYEGSFLTVEDMEEAARDLAAAYAAESNANTADAETRKAGRHEGREQKDDGRRKAQDEYPGDTEQQDNSCIGNRTGRGTGGQQAGDCTGYCSFKGG